MTSGYSVEQVFVRPKGAGLELAFVLVAPSGALKHDSLSFPTRSYPEAVSSGARHLAGRGDVDEVAGLRLRVERGGVLADDEELRRLFERTWTLGRTAED